MNLDHDFVLVWKFIEDQKKNKQMEHFYPQIQVKTKNKVFHKNRTPFSPNLHAQMYTHSNYWGDADEDHSQTIGGDTAKLLGDMAMPPHDFRFCPPIYFLPPTVFFWEKKVAVFSRKKHLNLWFRPEKAFGSSAKTFFFFFFFWKSPDFHWKFALIQFRNNENLGQVQRWFSALPPCF